MGTSTEVETWAFRLRLNLADAIRKCPTFDATVGNCTCESCTPIIEAVGAVYDTESKVQAQLDAGADPQMLASRVVYATLAKSVTAPASHVLTSAAQCSCKRCHLLALAILSYLRARGLDVQANPDDF